MSGGFAPVIGAFEGQVQPGWAQNPCIFRLTRCVRTSMTAHTAWRLPIEVNRSPDATGSFLQLRSIPMKSRVNFLSNARSSVSAALLLILALNSTAFAAPAAEAPKPKKPFKRVMVFSGGGFQPAVFLGMLE